MANPKRIKLHSAIKRIPKEKLGNKDLLSPNLAAQVGNLGDKNKITIRLDLRVLNAIKQEADKLGVGYQKLINDRLLEIYSLDEAQYLKNDSSKEIKELSKQIKELNKRLSKVERSQLKKHA